MPKGNPSDELTLTLNELRDVQWSRSCLVAALTLFFYDYLLTFEKEVQLIWQRPWSIVKGVYLWSRYFCLIYAIVILIGNFQIEPNEMVAGWHYLRFEGWLGIVLMITSDAVMLLWVHAIWGRDTRVLIGTGLLFAAEIGSVVVFYVFGYSAEHGELLIQTSLVGLLGPEPCVTFSIPNMFWKCWIPISIFEGVLLLLTLVKACQEWMEYLQRSPFGSSGVREMLLRNSLAQVLAIFCAYLTCCIMWLSEEPDRTPDLFGFVVMFSITLCCRLMLRIRDAFYNRDTRQTSNFMHVSFDDEGIRSCTPFFASDSQHDNVDPVLNTDWRRELRQMRPASI